MITPAVESWTPLRTGLMTHLSKGLMNKDDYLVFVVLLQMAARQKERWQPATVLTNAKLVAEEFRLNLKLVQNAFYRLRGAFYIHYEDRRGVKGPYLLFINKYRVSFGRGLTFYTDIFRESHFIGEKAFFAQLKVLNLHTFLGSGFRLSIRSFRLSSDIEIDFAQDFANLVKDIDKYTAFPFVNRALCDIDLDFKPDFSETLARDSDIDIYIFKESEKKIPLRKDPNKDDTQRLSDLCDQLKNLNHGFNPIAFVKYTKNSDIPFQVTEFVLSQLVKYKAKIIHAWPYALEILKREYSHRHYAEQLLKHEELKQFDFIEAMKNVKVV